MKEISRKQFFRLCGAIVAGGAVAGMSGVLLSRRARQPGAPLPRQLRLQKNDAPASPYRLVASFDVPNDIRAIAQHGGALYVATQSEVVVFDARGQRQRQFPTCSPHLPVRDMAVDDRGELYLLHPASIGVYSQEGALLREWEACSNLSSYCSFALAADCVFATDMANKNICKYTREGHFVAFIDSPNRFVIPSLTFGVECIGNVLYCSNSGRHQVEKYTLEGAYLGAFGKAGAAPGLFNGCCNPVHISRTPGGEVITSEKGAPRICCFGSDGAFRSVLLDGRSLGGGNKAFDVKVWSDRLFVAGKSSVSIFRYDATLAHAGACSSCPTGCALRTGVKAA